MSCFGMKWSCVVLLACSLVACGDDGVPGDSTGGSSGDVEPTSTGIDTTPPTTSASTSSTTTSETTGSTTDAPTSSESSGSGSDSGSESGSSSSSTGEDIDIECEGPIGDDTCENPSPFGGFGECDPFAQDCPKDEKCMPWANDGGVVWNATRCAPVVPAAQQLGEDCLVEGSAVSGVDNCDIGLVCFDVDPRTNAGVCYELCGCGPDEPTCAGDGTTCVVSNDGVLPLCVPPCDPLGDDCDDGEGCYQSESVFLCAPDSSGGQGAAGDECLFANGCDPGLLCAFGDTVPGCTTTFCCTEFCDLDTGNADCSNAGADCLPLFEPGSEPEECHADLGLCVSP